MRHFIILILYLTTLSISYGEIIPIEKYGKKTIPSFTSLIELSLDISNIKKGEIIYLTYTSPNSIKELFIKYFWTKDNYKSTSLNNKISENSVQCPASSETNIGGRKTNSIYCSIEKKDDLYNTLVIDLFKDDSTYFEYLQVQHTKDNPISGILTIVIIIIILIFIVPISICCCCCFGCCNCCRNNDMLNQYSYQNGIVTNMNNDMAIPMYNQYNYPPNNQYNNQLYNQYNK